MKEIKKYHDGIIAFLVLIIAIIILTVILFKTQPDVYIYISNERDSLHDLLNNQYTTLLTTIGIFVTIFSIAIPLYQRQKIKDEIDELKNIKENFPEMQKDFQSLKQAKDTVKKSINIMQDQNKKSKNLIIAMLPTSLNLYLESYKQKHNERKAYLFIMQIFIVLSELREEKEFNRILSLITASSVALKSIQEEFFNSALQKIKNTKSFNSLIMSIKTLPDSNEKKEFMELYNILFDEQSKDSSEGES